MNVLRLYRFGICIVLMSVSAVYSPAEMAIPGNVVDLPTMISAPHFEVDKFAPAWAASLAAAQGKQEAAKTLAIYASDNPLTVDQLYSLRKIGSYLQPEFGSVVLEVALNNSQPFAKGRLINLLRGGALKDTSAIVSLLSDFRSAEDLNKLAAADGAIPFRVRDVAYNVLLATQSNEKSSIKLLVRSSSLEERDEVIASRKQILQLNTKPPPPTAEPPTSATPIPFATLLPSPVVIGSSTSKRQFQSSIWLWMVGMVALMTIVALVIKRRA